jgi:putative glutamine amidotransferase
VNRPLVAITSGYAQAELEAFQLNKAYVRSVEAAGALPLVLVPGLPDDAPRLLDRLAGLLLSGGADVDPRHFGEARLPSVTHVIPERDAFEIALVQEALSRDLPILAICRGIQLLNVAAGGTLVQDIPSQVTGALNHSPSGKRWDVAHDVELQPGSRLRALFGGAVSLDVNSRHHQAVREVGRDLLVAARSSVDGVIEGLESRAHGFVVGVQWHPEDYVDRDSRFAPLFVSWVKACAAR